MTEPTPTSTPRRADLHREASPGRSWIPDAADLIAIGIITLTIALTVPGLFRYQGPPMEEGFMLAFPEQILKGELPHRDFLHLYGPGSLWLLAGAYKLFGVSLTVERLLGLGQHILLTFSMFALLRPFGRKVATAAAVISFLILIGPAGLTAMAWNGALALGVCSLAVGARAAHSDRPGARWLALTSGVLASLALLFRPDLIIAMGLGAVAILFRLRREHRSHMVIGAVAAIALYIPHFILSGFSEAFRGMFIEPVFELRGGRTLPVPPSWDQVDGFLQKAGLLRFSGWPLPMLDPSHQIFIWFWLVPLSLMIGLYGAWRLRRREPTSPRTTALLPAALFSAALVTQALQRPDTTHLAWVTGVSFPLLIPAIQVLLEEAAHSWGSTRRVAAAIAVPVVVLVAVIPFYPVRTYVDLVGQSFGVNRFGFPVHNDGRTFYLGDSGTADAAQQITDRLAELSEPGQSVVAGPVDMSRTNYNDSFFYYLFPELEAGTRYIEMDPGIADAPGSGLAEELRHNDWLIQSDVWSGWIEPNDSAKSRSQEANRVIEKHYCEVEDAGAFRLLERCR